MKAWDITIEGDAGGFRMRVRTEDCDKGDCDFWFAIPPDVAEQLFRGVGREIVPWLIEKEAARSTLVSRTTVSDVESELEAGVYDDEPGKRVWAERVVRGETPL